MFCMPAYYLARTITANIEFSTAFCNTSMSFTHRENWGLGKLRNLFNVTKCINEELGIWGRYLTVTPKTHIVMARLSCLWLLTLIKQWFIARGLGSRWFFLPSDSHIHHFLSTSTVTSCISVDLIRFTSDLLILKSCFSNLLSILPLSWDGLKHNFDHHVPLLLLTYPWIPKACGMKSEFVRKQREMFCHLPNVLSPSSFLLTLHAKWSCLSTHYPQNFLAWLLSALSLSPSPALVYLLGFPPKSLLLSPSPGQISPSCDAPLSAQLEVGTLVSNLAAHFLGTLDQECALCLALFVIMWSDIHIKDP